MLLAQRSNGGSSTSGFIGRLVQEACHPRRFKSVAQAALSRLRAAVPSCIASRSIQPTASFAGGSDCGTAFRADRSPRSEPFFAGAKLHVVDIKLHIAVHCFIGGEVDHIPGTIFAGYPKLIRVHDAGATMPT